MSSVDVDYDDLFLKSDYVDSCQHTTFNKKRKEIFVIYFSVGSLQKHIDELNSVLVFFKNQPEIVAISEIKTIKRKINQNINLDGYNFIHCYSVTRAGGIGLYINNILAYKIHEHSKAELTNAEHLWVEIQTKQWSFVVGVVHRHLDENAVSIDRFSDEFNEFYHCRLTLRRILLCFVTILSQRTILSCKVCSSNRVEKHAILFFKNVIIIQL